MFGQFQHSNVRLEIRASSSTIRDCLTQPQQLKKWLTCNPWQTLPQTLNEGSYFTTKIGVIPITHTIETLNENGMRLLLSQGIDGVHAWSWGDGWIQSHLEGVSLLPLNFSQTLMLLRLRFFVEAQKKTR